MTALDIAWGVLLGVVSWAPSWLVRSGGRFSRAWVAPVELFLAFGVLFVYWRYLNPHPSHFTDRVFAFSVSAVTVAVGGRAAVRRRTRNLGA